MTGFYFEHNSVWRWERIHLQHFTTWKYWWSFENVFTSLDLLLQWQGDPVQYLLRERSFTLWLLKKLLCYLSKNPIWEKRKQKGKIIRWKQRLIWKEAIQLINLLIRPYSFFLNCCQTFLVTDNNTCNENNETRGHTEPKMFNLPSDPYPYITSSCC